MSVNQLLLLLLALSSTFVGWHSQSVSIDGRPTGAQAPVVVMATPTPTPAPEVVDEALLAKGKAIYLSQYCGICHMLPAAETRGNFGPSHDHVATLAAQRLADGVYTGKAQTLEEYLRESIVDPSAYFVPKAANGRHPMPSYAHLPEADIDALVYLLMQQK